MQGLTDVFSEYAGPTGPCAGKVRLSHAPQTEVWVICPLTRSPLCVDSTPSMRPQGTLSHVSVVQGDTRRPALFSPHLPP